MGCPSGSLYQSKTPHTAARCRLLCKSVAHTRRVALHRVASPLAEGGKIMGGGGRIDGDGFFRRTIKLILFDSD